MRIQFEIEFMKLCILRYLRARAFPYAFSEEHENPNVDIVAYNKNYSYYNFILFNEESEILYYFKNRDFLKSKDIKKTNFIYVVVPLRLGRLMELILRINKRYDRVGIISVDVSVSNKTYEKKAFKRVKMIKNAEFIPYHRNIPNQNKIMGRMMRESLYLQKRYIENMFDMQIDSYDLNTKRKKEREK